MVQEQTAPKMAGLREYPKPPLAVSRQSAVPTVASGKWNTLMAGLREEDRRLSRSLGGAAA